ncbi:MAG: hypothetical protein ABIG86_02950 [Patescibacteria group bacterium]
MELMSEGFKSFIDSLERLIEKPPYLLFVFIAAVFVIISLITKYNFEKIWIFFLYSVGGTIWRYAEKDLVSPFKKHPSSKLGIRVVYHLGNLGLFIALLHYLNFI